MTSVIFDMDGVLIDNEPLHYATDKQLLQELGIIVPENYLDKFVGMTNPVMWTKILEEFNRSDSVDKILEKQLALKIALLHKDNYQPINGITELLQHLQKNTIKMAVASSSSVIFIKAVLEKLGIEKYFEFYISGESIAKSKPEPDIFLKAAQMLRTEPAECIVIEDSKNGVIAAKRAGMKCIGYINKNSGNQDLSHANKIIDNFHSLTFETLQSLVRE